MPPATKQTPEERIAELEEQLSLSDQGVSKLAQRCLALEQQLAALEKHETYDNMSLFRLTLYYDYGLGFSQQDTLSAPVSAYSASNHTVSAIFEMPREVRGHPSGPRGAALLCGGHRPFRPAAPGCPPFGRCLWTRTSPCF